NVHLNHVFYNLALRALLVDDPYVKRVMLKFYDQTVGQKNWTASQPIFIDLRKTNFNLNQDGGCLEKSGRPHPMGVSQFALAEPICVSIPLLRSVPDNELNKQIVGLFVHEFAHHFGFGEFDASKIQHYVLKNYEKLAWFPEEITIKLSDVELKPAANERGLDAFFLFQRGKAIERNELDESEPYCQLSVQYDDNSFDESLKKKKRFSFKTGDVSLRLISTSSSASCDSKGCGVRGLHFQVNRVWDGNSWRGTGARLHATDGSGIGASIYGVDCSGTSLKHMDIPLTFQELINEVY
ncbi:MAG: hypothetical protein K2X47_00790, partial [Bdellovibrionales bacterium]|nr:hypothetical protein [Bdellovibrionales bacterium]